jgi:hypothetical protein
MNKKLKQDKTKEKIRIIMILKKGVLVHSFFPYLFNIKYRCSSLKRSEFVII